LINSHFSWLPYSTVHTAMHTLCSHYSLLNSMSFNGRRCKHLFVRIHITQLYKTTFHIFRTLIYLQFRSDRPWNRISHLDSSRSSSPYKPRTGQCMNHALAILAAPTLYSTHQVLVVWIIVAHFHLCSLLGMLSCYTVLEQFDGRCVFAVAVDGDSVCFSLTFWTVWWPLAWCIIWPCIHYTAGAASMADAWFIRTPSRTCLKCALNRFYSIINIDNIVR